MKPLVLTLAGAAVVLALVSEPALARQGRERPAGAGSAGASGVRTGGESGGGSAAPRGGSGSGSAGTYTAPSPSSGGSSGSSAGSSAGSYGGSSGGARVRGGSAYSAGGGNPGYIRPGYGTAEDRAVPRGARPNPGGTVTGQGALRNPGPPASPIYPGHRPPGGGYSPVYPYYPY
jgi:hypothetical protein